MASSTKTPLTTQARRRNVARRRLSSMTDRETQAYLVARETLRQLQRRVHSEFAGTRRQHRVLDPEDMEDMSGDIQLLLGKRLTRYR